MCAITETNSAAKTIRSFEGGGGGQECSCRAATSVAVMMAWNIAHAKVVRPYTSKSWVWHSYKSPEGHTTLRSIWLLDIKQSPSTTRVTLGYIVCCCKSLKKSSWTPLSSTDGESITLVKLHRRWLLWKLPHHPSPSWRQLYNYLVFWKYGDFLDKGQRLVGDIQEVIKTIR